MVLLQLLVIPTMPAAAKKPVKKTVAKKKSTGAKKPIRGSYQDLMPKELEKLRTKYNYKTGGTNNKKTWQEIFSEAAKNAKKAAK